jgi:hypothetical protein
MFSWVHDFPVWMIYPFFLVLFIGGSVVASFIVQPRLRRMFDKYSERNEVIDPIIGYMGLIFGILIGSLAITTHQSQTSAQDSVMKEASTIAVLYRSFSQYPEPKRAELQMDMRDYTRFLIEEMFPALAQGITLTAGNDRLTRIHQALGSFEPPTKGQEILHAETSRTWNEFISHRRMRVFNSSGSIPDFFWITLLVGWALSLVLLWMLSIPFGLQLALGSVLACAMATLVCLIALMDHPFRGELSVSTEPYRLVYEQLMRSAR